LGGSGAVSCSSCPAGQFARVPEVFHVSDGYNVAQSNAAGVCQALGARLASVYELEAAQARGAEWCSCGWTSDGTARYPMFVHSLLSALDIELGRL
jgi:hyaluronan/proteoglycan link protein 3